MLTSIRRSAAALAALWCVLRLTGCEFLMPGEGGSDASVNTRDAGVDPGAVDAGQTCSNACALNDKQCAGSYAAQTCVTGASGCRDWGAPVGCGAGQFCSFGECVTGCAADMAKVTALGICIDKYEASQGASGEAVSVAGAMPWVSLDTAQAQAACAAAGKRLCTEAEWQGACGGPSGQIYPYGNTYSATACNGLDSGLGAIVETGSVTSCQGGYPGIFDMSGNAYERTATCSGGTCRVKGGSYRSSAGAQLLRCDTGFDFPESGPDPAVGFRCCR